MENMDVLITLVDWLDSMLEREIEKNDMLRADLRSVPKEIPPDPPVYTVDGIQVMRDDVLWIVSMFNKLRRDSGFTYESNPSNVKIPLIKEVRAKWNYDLKEAKDIVEMVLAL